MLQFFSKTRNITGLVLLIGPMLAVLTGDRPVSFWAPFFAAMTLSLPLLRIALQNLPFRLSASVFTAAFFFGIFQSQVHPELSALLLGCGSSMLLLLPPLLMTGQFPGSWVQTLALAWSFSILTMPCFRASGFLFLPAMAAGVFFLKKPSESWKYCYTPLILEQRKLYPLKVPPGRRFSRKLPFGSAWELHPFLQLSLQRKKVYSAAASC